MSKTTEDFETSQGVAIEEEKTLLIDEYEEGYISPDELLEVLRAPIRSETYIENEEDAQFVAPDTSDEEVLSETEDLSAHVDVLESNIIPAGTFRSRRKALHSYVVPTPDLDELECLKEDEVCSSPEEAELDGDQQWNSCEEEELDPDYEDALDIDSQSKYDESESEYSMSDEVNPAKRQKT
jgi:hypothetical protein